MVGIISIATVLVLNKSEEPGRCRPGCGNIAANQSAVAFELVGEVASAGAVAKAGHVESGAAARHCCLVKLEMLGDKNEYETDAAVPKSAGEGED